MKYCDECKVLNEENASVCKICGKKLDNKKVVKKEQKVKTKKARPKTKIKYKTKEKTKTIVKDKREKGRMNFFQKFMFFILFNLCLVLISICGYLGYHIYINEYIDIPDVTGYTYESAEEVLKEKKLEAEKEEIEVSEENVGIVVKQSKKGKASKNDTIKLYVGVLKKEIIVPDITGISAEDAIKILNEKNINYKIAYEYGKNENIVIKQSVKKGTKIKPDDSITLTISKIEKQEEIEENSKEMTN